MTLLPALMSMSLLAAPAQASNTDKINEAVRKGADFLRSHHAGGINGGQHGPGAVALSGMALLAAGAKNNDATVSGIANALRPQVFTNTKTYDNALMLLFFDKLGDQADEVLIQILGVKLLSGQNSQGGWGYDTWNNQLQLDAAGWLQVMRGWKPDGRLHPKVAELYRTVRGVGRSSGGPAVGGAITDDNSNTQFAVIAVWVAGRHAVPIREAAFLIDSRFLRTQDPMTGGWAYSGFGGSTPSMTCAGLLGLAVAYGSRLTGKLEADGSDGAPKPKKPEDDDPFLKPPGPGGEKKDDKDSEAIEDPLVLRRKAAIDRGLAALGRILAGNRGGANAAGAGGFGGADDLYFYWSVERVGVAFGLEKIGGVDWYEWGVPSLLSSQAQDGSWGGSYGKDVNTSFAILFLTRANFAIDLSAKLKGKGFGGELRGGGVPMMKAIPFAEQAIPKAEPGKPPPKISGIRDITQADGLADALVGASNDDFPKKLKEFQAAKGEQYTAAITFSLNRLEKDRKKLARAALVERLTRMTPETLRKMTAVNEPELRRAACLACASKDDKQHIPDLIARINDTDDEVVKAARAGLRSLTNEDFGPLPGAGEEEKNGVRIRWNFWLQDRGKKG